ncbi:MAG: hypothetical protein V1721_10125 [Pseudomonadota bacterium]
MESINSNNRRIDEIMSKPFEYSTELKDGTIVTLTVTSRRTDFFEKSLKEVKDLEGEALIAALKTLSKGDIGIESRRKGSDKIAWELNPDGTPSYEAQYRNGDLVADRGFDEKGIPYYQTRRGNDGVTYEDGSNGEFARQIFNREGDVVHAESWKDGKLVNKFKFENNQIVHMENWKDGKLDKVLTLKEIADYVAQSNKKADIPVKKEARICADNCLIHKM